ncbi:MAG: hypothetical protein IPP07_28510 [Holophagales bacterium]|nr:hypothetical protein [Holophagales bacterium]
MKSRNTLVACFLLVLVLPGAANLAGFSGANPEGENRRMAEFPRLDARPATLAALPAAFTAWFDDSFGFRSHLVRWSSEFRYFVLGVSPTTTVARGEDGWLYYADDSGMDDYSRESPFTAAALDDWRETLVRSREWLDGEGIGFVFAIAPDKHVVYPEHLPSSIRPVGDTYRMDQLFRTLDGSGVVTVDFREALFAAKARERLFEKTDTHWNERGAFVAYQQLVGAIREQVPAVPPAWAREEFEAVSRDESALDLAGMIGLKDVLREERLLLRPRRARLARIVEPVGGEPWWGEGRIVTEIPGSTLPRAVVFRDSFTSRLAPYLSEHFSRVVYLWQDNFDAGVIREEKPAVVIQEIVGRHLLYVSPYSSAPAR